jgi:hypothetical protein
MKCPKNNSRLFGRETSSGKGEIEALFAKSKAIDEICFEYVVTEGEKEETAGKAWFLFQ